MRGWLIRSLALAAFVASCGGKSELDKTGGGGNGGSSDGGGSGGNAARWQPRRRQRGAGVRGRDAGHRRRISDLGARRRRAALGAVPVPAAAARHRPPERIDRPGDPRRQAVFGVREDPRRLPERPAHGPGRGEAVVEDRAGDGPGRVVQPGHLAPGQRRRRPLLSVRQERRRASTARPSPPACSSCSRSIPRRPTPTRVGSMRRCRPPVSSRRRVASSACMGCHETSATHERLFGVPLSPSF